MTERSRQVFSALELGPGCLVLGISSKALKAEMSWEQGPKGQGDPAVRP